MSGPSSVKDEPIRGRDQLVGYLAEGEKPAAAWRIGTEHEKFGFRLDDLRPPTWEGERGIGVLLEGMTRFGWQRVEEDGKLIALVRDNASVTLEPAGQLELSGAPLETIHDTCCEVACHLQEVKAVADEIGVGFLGMPIDDPIARPSYRCGADEPLSAGHGSLRRDAAFAGSASRFSPGAWTWLAIEKSFCSRLRFSTAIGPNVMRSG